MVGQEPVSSQQAGGGAQVIVERPEPGLARGQYAWPAWAIGALGGGAALLGLAFLVWRWRRERRKR